MKPEHYSLLIQWDNDDQIYVVSVPELPGARTHGKTYEEAIKNALEVIELWLDTEKALGWDIPQPGQSAA
jgi:predicted RNase H-like HicB family nuclease